jgi:hypothetical protein
VRSVIFTLLAIIVTAFCATQTVDARTHHRTPKAAVPVATTKADAKIPVETKRDPADVALDRKIKGICKGC